MVFDCWSSFCTATVPESASASIAPDDESIPSVITELAGEDGNEPAETLKMEAVNKMFFGAMSTLASSARPLMAPIAESRDDVNESPIRETSSDSQERGGGGADDGAKTASFTCNSTPLENGCEQRQAFEVVIENLGSASNILAENTAKTADTQNQGKFNVLVLPPTNEINQENKSPDVLSHHKRTRNIKSMVLKQLAKGYDSMARVTEATAFPKTSTAAVHEENNIEQDEQLGGHRTKEEEGEGKEVVFRDHPAWATIEEEDSKSVEEELEMTLEKAEETLESGNHDKSKSSKAPSVMSRIGSMRLGKSHPKIPSSHRSHFMDSMHAKAGKNSGHHEKHDALELQVSSFGRCRSQPITSAKKIPLRTYDYFQVVISNNDTDMMIRIPCKQNLTFSDLRHEIEEDGMDDLPFANNFKFTVEANGMAVSRRQEKKWKVRDYDLTKQGGDGSYKKPYRVYIKEDKLKEEKINCMDE